MAKLVWFLALVVSLALVTVLSGYKDLPIDNTNFQTQEKMRIEAEEKEKAEAARLAKEALEASKKPVVKELVLDTPELKRGFELYHNKGKCITCHGKKGEGKASQKAPKLAGQHDWYILSSLKAFKSGERINTKMNPYLKNLNEADFKDIATYLSKLPPQ